MNELHTTYVTGILTASRPSRKRCADCSNTAIRARRPRRNVRGIAARSSATSLDWFAMRLNRKNVAARADGLARCALSRFPLFTCDVWARTLVRSTTSIVIGIAIYSFVTWVPNVSN